MVVAIVCGGVSGSAWLAAAACRLGAWLQCPTPARALPCGCRSPVRLASADRLSLASAGAHADRPRQPALGEAR